MDAYVGAWNYGDADAVAAFFAVDAVYDDRGAAERAQGRGAIRAHVAAVMRAFPDLRFEIVNGAHAGEVSWGEWRAAMTHRGDLFGLAATGRRIESAGVDVARLGDDGLVTGLVSYYDGAAILRQLGLLPRRGSRLERALLRAASLPRRRS
jgi:steroid delta-isomerase-like uncharacterized protein